MIKYEDFVSSPQLTLRDLYTGLNLDFDEVAAHSLYNHLTRAVPRKNSPKQPSKKYFSTYRGSDNDISKWRSEFPREKIRNIEQNCHEFMEKVGYDVQE